MSFGRINVISTHPDSSRLATQISYNTVPLWVLQVGSTFEDISKILCSYCMHNISGSASSHVFQLAVATAVLVYSVPSKALCHEIGSALWKISSTDFLKMCEKDAFSC